ncbi:MAG: serine hydrolase domain-containing protein [Bacteroidota bacterium]|jgi:D-alanyl-D-alanine carboxypeptidase
MKRILVKLVYTFFVSLAILSCTKKSTDYVPSTSSQIQSSLQSMIDKMVTDYRSEFPGFPGGLALKVSSKNGSYFVSSGFSEAITDQYHFRIASLTKVFTSTSIVLLAQEGKLNLDAKLTDTIPGTSMTYIPQDANYNIPYKDQITIRLLLEHNAGVFDVSNALIPDTVTAPVPYKGKWYIGYVMDPEPEHTFTFDELVGVVSTCRLFLFPPGQGHHYSNTGYSILGKIIERVSGMSYPQFVTENIFNPMGLNNSYAPYKGDDQLIPQPFVRGFKYSPAVVECTKSNISANVAEGNLISNADDLSRFMRSLIRGEGVLSPVWVNDFMLVIPKTSFDNLNYALGITYAQNLGWGHTGAHEGFYTRMVTDPVNDITIVAFVNSWNEVPGAEIPLIMKIEEACYKARNIVQ